MLEGLYSAAAGMAAQQQRMDSLANDVANVNTAGYKHVRLGFRDLVYAATTRGAAADVTQGAGCVAGVDAVFVVSTPVVVAATGALPASPLLV